MKIFKSIIILLVVTMSFTSCDSFLDVNEDINNPTADVVPPSLMLVAAQNGSYSCLTTRQNQFGNIMMNQWAGDVTNFTGGNDDEYNYNITTNFYSAIWDNMYLATDKLQGIINKDSEVNTNYTAIAEILKAHNMQYVVDIYGDAPYSEAFNRGENSTPAYDDAKDIYMDLYTTLDEAVSKINGAGLNAENPGNYDAIFNGDMGMWVKLANTLKLKLLVRASSSSDSAVQSWVNTKFSELTGASFLGAGENVTINPGYVQESGKQNIFYDYMGYKFSGDQQQNNKFTIGSGYFIEFLKSTNDTRISKYFTMTNGTYQGIIQGADDPVDPSIGLSFIGDGLLNSPSQDGIFFTASESLFLQAEAALNGKLAGDAQALFETAVSESFSLLGLTSDAAGYVATLGSVDLEKIITQKWIALHGTDGLETYVEHLRTGYPNPPLPLLTSDTHRPYRLMYPASEFTGNSANTIDIPRASLFSPSLFYQQ